MQTRHFYKTIRLFINYLVDVETVEVDAVEVNAVEVDAVDGAERAEGLRQPLGPNREPCAEVTSPVQMCHPSAIRRFCVEPSARREPERDA